MIFIFRAQWTISIFNTSRNGVIIFLDYRMKIFNFPINLKNFNTRYVKPDVHIRMFQMPDPLRAERE